VQRRKLLGWVGGACIGSASGGAAIAQTQLGDSSGEPLTAHPAPRLDEVARRSGRRYGFAVHPGYADKEPVRSLLQQHAGIITAENAMKWRNIENAFGARDYGQADRVVAIATGLNAPLRGHTLAWHQSTPGYLTGATPEQFAKAQTAHLQALMLRYKGRIHTWDVLNEVIDADVKTKGGMRDSVLARLWGVDKYPALFELAREADPQAKLAYNDYGIEQDEPWCEARRLALLRMLEGWVKRGTPVDVMGLQAHLDLSRRFSEVKLLRFFDELQALGLSIQITELDVRDTQYPGDVPARDAAVAGLYKAFMDTCVNHPAVEMIVMWNVTDDDSWVNRWAQGQRRADGLPQRPTLFDAQGQPKPAFHAVARSLRDATVKFDRKKARHV
jgi:endo-1,4-beta-xylanase